jgi:hypothetical protein
MATKKPYAQRTDIEKVISNWTKTLGLLERGEYSVSVVRAAVSLELATNFVIRQELIHARNLDAKFVDHLLIWANGLKGKFQQLLIPITKGSDKEQKIDSLSKRSKVVNDERNSVAHSGQFKSEKTARRVVTLAREIIVELVQIHDPTFQLGGSRKEQLTLH